MQLYYTYDPLNRLASKSSSDGTVNTNIYRNDYGRQQAITSPASTTYLAFDALGRTTGSTQATAGQNYYFGYSYDAAGLLMSETYPSGRVMTTSYDQAGREFALQGNRSGALTNYVTQAYYTPSGNMYYFIRGNGVWHATGYNPRLQPTESYEALNNNLGSMYFVSCTNWGDGPNGSSPAYTRAGNVYKVCPDMAASVNNGSLRGYTEMNGGPGYPSFLQFNQSFSYDALNRLTGVNDSGGYVRNFQYDPWGNMSLSNNSGVPQSGITPQTSNTPFNTANNRLWSGTYDAAGNQTQMGSVALGYDAENHQIRSQDSNDPGVSYSYDGEGHRVSKAIDGGATTVYVYDAQGRLISEYTTAPGTLNPPCWICFLSYDHLGNVRLITGHDAGIVARHDYLAFGEEVFAGYAGRDARFGAYDSVAQRFTGQQADAESSLNYFYARYFGGRLGRFTSPDPENAGADLMNPQSWNGYSYGLNNPLLNTDPTGMFASAKGKDATPAGPDPSPIQFFGFCFPCGLEPYFGDFGKMSFAPPPPPMTYQPQKFIPKPAKTGTQPCVAPNLLQRAGIAIQARLANYFNKTIGLGAGGSIGAGNKVGVSLSVLRQLVVAPNGQAAFATSVSTFNGQIFNSVTTKGYGGYGGIQFSISNAHNVNDLGGSALNYGFGGGDGWGGGFDFSTDLQTWQATGTVGGGFGGYGHGLQNVTTSISPICGG